MSIDRRPPSLPKIPELNDRIRVLEAQLETLGVKLEGNHNTAGITTRLWVLERDLAQLKNRLDSYRPPENEGSSSSLFYISPQGKLLVPQWLVYVVLPVVIFIAISLAVALIITNS